MRPSGGPLVVGDLVVVAGVAAEIHAYRVLTGDAGGQVRVTGRSGLARRNSSLPTCRR